MGSPSEASDFSAEEILERIEELSTQITKLSELGFTTDMPKEELSEAIRGVSPDHVSTVGRLLKPYFDSLEARIDGLTPISNRLATFSSIVNAFFRSKTFEINAVRGIQVVSKNDDPISPQMLSSGEKHLLLMCVQYPCWHK